MTFFIIMGLALLFSTLNIECEVWLVPELVEYSSLWLLKIAAPATP